MIIIWIQVFIINFFYIKAKLFFFYLIGKMFPCQGELHVSPFQDETLYNEQFNKAMFWYQSAFYNVDLGSLRESAHKEYFRQPIVDTFDIRICTAKSVKHIIDFRTADESSLHKIGTPVFFLQELLKYVY